MNYDAYGYGREWGPKERFAYRRGIEKGMAMAAGNEPITFTPPMTGRSDEHLLNSVGYHAKKLMDAKSTGLLQYHQAGLNDAVAEIQRRFGCKACDEIPVEQPPSPAAERTERLIAAVERLTETMETKSSSISPLPPPWRLTAYIRALQGAIGVAQDGLVGPDTLKALRERGLTWKVAV